MCVLRGSCNLLIFTCLQWLFFSRAFGHGPNLLQQLPRKKRRCKPQNRVPWIRCWLHPLISNWSHTHKNVAKHYLWQKSVTQCNEGSKTDGSRPRNCSRGRLTDWIHSSTNLRWGSSLMARLATTRICSSLDWRTPLQTTSHILPPITTKAREAGSSSADGARGWQMKTKWLKHCIEPGHQKTKMNAIKYGLGNKE